MCYVTHPKLDNNNNNDDDYNDDNNDNKIRTSGCVRKASCDLRIMSRSS